MRGFIPPLCLVLALLCFVLGFTLIAVGPPEADMKLHRARVVGEDELTQALEEELEHRRLLRGIVIAGAFASGALLVATAFATMKSSGWAVRR